MKFLQHMTNARHNRKHAELMAEYGFEGYGLFWFILEEIAERYTAGNYGYRYSIKRWADLCRRSEEDLFEFLGFCSHPEINLLEYEVDGRWLTISVPNIAKYHDNYTRQVMRERAKKETENTDLQPETNLLHTDCEVTSKQIQSNCVPSSKKRDIREENRREYNINNTSNADSDPAPADADADQSPPSDQMPVKKANTAVTPEPPLIPDQDQDPIKEPPGPHYLTKRKRRLAGWKLTAFDLLWDAFDLKSGKADAADAFLDIPGLSKDLVKSEILPAARKEADIRARKIAQDPSHKPKWLQGWLTARRWEDEAYRKGNRPARAQPQTPEEIEAEEVRQQMLKDLRAKREAVA